VDILKPGLRLPVSVWASHILIEAPFPEGLISKAPESKLLLFRSLMVRAPM